MANSFPVLADAGNCHMHFFGPPEHSPGASNRAYTPYLRTEEQYWSIMRPLGFSRVAVLQPSAYHFDNHCTMDVVVGDPSRYRGVAVIPLDIANDELAAPDKAGARGIRFNIVTTGLPAGMTATLCSNRRSGWFVPLAGTCRSLRRPSRFCAVDPAVRPVWLGVAVAAPAYPVTCAPGDNLAIHVALEMVPRGSVLVIATGGESVKSLGRYAASWIAGWPNRPSSTAALT